MSADLLIGLQISLTGLLVTFFSLGLLILLIRLLVRLFPVREQAQTAAVQDEDAVADLVDHAAPRPDPRTARPRWEHRRR